MRPIRIDYILADFTVESWGVRSAITPPTAVEIGRRTQTDGQGSDCGGGRFNFQFEYRPDRPRRARLAV
jgi:hypothetical protein